MKAISIREPWASAIADGRKTIEIRSWRTSHKGPLLICSTAPDSTALCVTTIRAIDKMRPEHESQSFCPCHSGALAWHLSSPCPIKKFPVKGRQGLFDIPDELIHPRLHTWAPPERYPLQIRQWLQMRGIDTKPTAR